MIFKKIKKAVKNVFKGAKKLFKKVGDAFGKLMKNKFFKIVAIGAALVFTAGAAAAAFPAFAGTSLASTLSTSALTKGIFAAGGKLATAAGFAANVGASASGTVGAGTAVAGGAEAAAGLSTVAPGVSPAVASAVGASGNTVAAGTAANAVAGGASGGLLSQVGAAAGKVAGYVGSNPGAALLAGNIIEGATAPDPDELAEKELRRQRSVDNRYGVNNLTGQVGLDVTQDAQSFDRIGESYTGGLLARVQAQREQQLRNPSALPMPGAYNPQYSAPPPVMDPTRSA